MHRLALISLLLLTACGGGNNSSSPPPPPPPLPLPVQDTTPPVITLTGSNPQVIATGDAYMDLGATATDDVDGDISASITSDASAVGTDTAGDYVVTYAVTDTAGNTATVTRIVRVENPPPPPVPAAPVVSIDVGTKRLIISWADVPGASSYRLLENADGHSGFTQVGASIPAGTLTVTLPIAVHSHNFADALYVLESCNATGCSGSNAVNARNGVLASIGYFKASNTDIGDRFGTSVALSTDGHTLAVGAPFELSNATGINGDQSDNSVPFSGAVYIFRFDGANWFQETYIKASNTNTSVNFGSSVALSANGNTLSVGALTESSSATGINGDQNDESTNEAGAVYVFRFDGANWFQEAYVKASNTGRGDRFGSSVALSADGNTLAAGAMWEDSSAKGVNGDQSDNSAYDSGAAYLFRFDGIDWIQEAYIKASNTTYHNPFDGGDEFGTAVALSADGNTLAVSAPFEWSNATGINGDQDNELAIQSGAVFLFRNIGAEWLQQAYIKASNTSSGDIFGESITLSADGNTLAVGAGRESGGATGINGDQNDLSASESGAVYLFRFDEADWFQEAYIKASNRSRRFGFAVALSADGNLLAVGAPDEDGSATGINGDQNANTAVNAGAVYVFNFDGADWNQRSYVKASNTGPRDDFGGAVALGADGNTLAVGARFERSNATGINGDQNDDSIEHAGAVYLY